MKETDEKILDFGKLKVIQNPTEFPWGLSAGMIPENCKVLRSTAFDNRESYLNFTSDWTVDQVSTFYEGFFKNQDWRILQKEKKEDTLVYLTESQTRRLLSILIKADGNGTNVKLFHRRPGSL
jgi:hypothetical protein